jgi:anti-sigma B factor antagonist
MDTNDLTITTIRDGAVCTLILNGDLDISAASGFLQHASRVVGDRTGRLVLDLAGVTFLDCSGLRTLAIAAGFAPGGCPVIIRSLSPAVRRILALTGLNLENIREFNADPGPGTGLWDHMTTQKELDRAGRSGLDLDA